MAPKQGRQERKAAIRMGTCRPSCCSSTSDPPSFFLLSMFLVLGTVAATATATAQQPEDVVDVVAIPSELPEIRALDRPRAERFPTREERVKLYMSNWYLPPCEGYSEGRVSYYELPPAAAAANNSPGSDEEEWPTYHLQEAADIVNHTAYTMETSIEPDTAFVLDRATLLDCAVRNGGNDPRLKDRVQFRSNMYMYCLDVAQTFLPAVDHVQWELERAAAADDDDATRHFAVWGPETFARLPAHQPAAFQKVSHRGESRGTRTRHNNNNTCQQQQ